MPNSTLTATRPKILRAFDAYMRKYHSPDPTRPAPPEDLPTNKDELARAAAEDEAAHHQQTRRRI